MYNPQTSRVERQTLCLLPLTLSRSRCLLYVCFRFVLWHSFACVSFVGVVLLTLLFSCLAFACDLGLLTHVDRLLQLAFNGPLDQYFMNNPEKLFTRQLDGNAIDPENPELLKQHLICAAYEVSLPCQWIETEACAQYALMYRLIVCVRHSLLPCF